ncbi:hypothetical protein ACHHYP_06578 [Achlya hypogyna]|uniref:Reverse transcriptase zinc-binding domain-containing protein n=1 Tax=Achlya hypogyna TaxID=1202772 RepID=A0A1V9YT12_ACHHY|nr:hypothetical protein ACHHYP_06578 [Achlya hypogyna]
MDAEPPDLLAAFAADDQAAPALNIAPAGTPVRFLGVYVGTRVDPAYQTQLLHDRYFASFQHWGYRARTLQGRRLLAASVMTSILWHATAVIVLAPQRVKMWQRMLTRYVLGRKRDPTEPYRSLLHASWHHDVALGAGVPRIASTIRTQRLLALQQLMRQDDERLLWVPLVLEQFATCMGFLHRDSHPFDFLFYQPHIGSKWIKASTLHAFWFDVWRHWSKTVWAKGVAATPSYDMVTNKPVWLTTYKPMAIGATRHASKLVRVARGRRWFLYGASNGFRALRDFMAPSGFWYSWPQLATLMRRNNPGTRVHMGRGGRITVSAPPHGAAVYKHLCAVYDNVRRQYNVRTNTLLPRPEITGHPFRKLVKDEVLPFERWPRRDVRDLALHTPKPSRRHPLLSTSRPTLPDVKAFIKRTRKLLCVATPVHADVWHRLVMRMLPVNVRMAYKQHADPAIILCSHGCGAVETELHAFFTCPRIYPIWEWHDAAWCAAGPAVRWTSVTELDKFAVHARHTPLRSALHGLWAMAVAVTVHALWKARNAAHFDDTRLPPTPVLHDVIFTVWLATIRRRLRLLEGDSPERQALLAAAQLLFSQPSYRPLAAKYPLGLQPRPTVG